MARRQLFLILVGLFLAGCAAPAPQDTADLPTLAVLPTQVDTPTATETLPSGITPSPTLTASATLIPTEAPTLTVTPSATITDTPTPTATDTPPPSETPIPTADNEGLVALALMAAQATVLPQSGQLAVQSTAVAIVQPPTTSCTYLPPGGFGAIFLSDPSLIQQIGCPVGAPPITTSATSASQVFERGEMFWVQGPPPAIYVLFNTGRFQRYDDTFNATTDPISGGETPPSGLKEPIRGFGKVWRIFGDVRNGLGWAVNDEIGGQAVIQIFERGQMTALSQRGLIVILINDAGGTAGSWRAVSGNF